MTGTRRARMEGHKLNISQRSDPSIQGEGTGSDDTKHTARAASHSTHQS